MVTDLSEDVQVCLPSSVLAVGEEANEVNSSGQSVAAHRTTCALLFLVFVSLSGPRGARRRPGSRCWLGSWLASELQIRFIIYHDNDLHSVIY